MITEPMSVFATLCLVAALTFSLSQTTILKPVFSKLPPIIWLYFTPMVLTSLSVLPDQSDVYSWMSRYLLLVALFLLTLSVDIKSLIQVSKPAAIMLLVGTLSITVGSVVVFAGTQSILPANGWQGISMLSASWIGGSANMLAMQQNLQVNPNAMGPIVITDTVVGYGWLSIVILAAAFQPAIDRALGADDSKLNQVSEIATDLEKEKHPVQLPALAMIVGFGFFIAIIARKVADGLPQFGDPVIISQSTWAVIFIVSLGLGLSLTPVQKLRRNGSAEIGYVALYMLVTTIGAQADLRSVTQAPGYLVAGALILVFHATAMVLALRVLRYPVFFAVVGSIANVGGAASAPIAASAYRPALSPIGALLGVCGYMFGIYAPLFIAWVTSKI